VVVLGAGLLLDVPLNALSSLFREVVLVDIVFLPEVQADTAFRQCAACSA
jgi:hypothetical protein